MASPNFASFFRPQPSPLGDSINSAMQVALLKSRLDSDALNQQARASALTQQQETQQQLQAYQSEVGQLIQDDAVTPRAAASLIARYPIVGQAAAGALENLSEEQQKGARAMSLNVLASLEAGSPEARDKLLDLYETRAKEDGRQDVVAGIQAQRQLINIDPIAAKAGLTLTLTQTMGADGLENALGKLQAQRHREGLAPVEQRLVEAKTKTAEVTAKFAERKQRAELGRIRAVAKAAGDKPNSVQSVITRYKDGSASVLMRDGTAKMVAPGMGVVPQEREAAIRDAGLRSGVAFEGNVAGARAGAKEAVDIGTETANKAVAVRRNISNLSRAIELVEKEGANTGVIAKKLPSWNASTLELENIQQELGLDVVGMSKFGQLSKGELDLALNKGLPTGLDQDDLALWLRRKRRAQQKFLNQADRFAKFMLKPGNKENRLHEWLTRNDGIPARSAGEETPARAPATSNVDDLLNRADAALNPG